eukprot:TRINITY_DN3881_c1_g1_i2.p1 TRINITY_DN3881_c1_g1~~TRINITY_DN3881_c1_g1_i2.p1  ORF type:complete len:159 (+),score=30.80 TRINITY_DN3881_c1_g1_i2:221-697(+)
MMNEITDGNEVDLEEFVGSCLRVKGAATSIDLHMMAFETRVNAKKTKNLLRTFDAALQDVCTKTDFILSQVGSQCRSQFEVGRLSTQAGDTVDDGRAGRSDDLTNGGAHADTSAYRRPPPTEHAAARTVAEYAAKAVAKTMAETTTEAVAKSAPPLKL